MHPEQQVLHSIESEPLRKVGEAPLSELNEESMRQVCPIPVSADPACHSTCMRQSLPLALAMCIARVRSKCDLVSEQDEKQGHVEASVTLAEQKQLATAIRKDMGLGEQESTLEVHLALIGVLFL